DVGDEKEPILVVRIAAVDHEATYAPAPHDGESLVNGSHAVDRYGVGGHRLPNPKIGSLGHISLSTFLDSSRIWAVKPTASSTASWIARPDPGSLSNCPAAAMRSRMLEHKFSSTINSTMSWAAVSWRPRKVFFGTMPSPRALGMTVAPVAPASRAAFRTASTRSSCTSARI